MKNRVALRLRNLSYWFLNLMIVVASLEMRLSAEESAPFVAAYDRFYSNSEQEDLDAGRLLLTELSCTACHQAGKELAPKGGPHLNGVVSRLQRNWIRSYLHSPGHVKSGGAMPGLLHQIPETERDDAIDALVAFLTDTEAIEPKIVASGGNPVAHEFWLKGDVARGRGLYHQIGCIACHAIDSDFQPAKSVQSDLERKIESLGLEPEELKEMGLVIPKPIQPVPMSSISTKYTLRSLSMFLIAPHLVRPAGRMPSLKLQPHEAADISTYLFRDASEITHDAASQRQSSSQTKMRSDTSNLVEQGRTYFEQLACVNCHANPKSKPRLAMPLMKLNISEIDKGCLANSPNSPRFGLSDSQKKALQTSIASLQKSKSANVQIHPSFTMLQLNCYACHERGGRGGVGLVQGPYFENAQQIDIGDEGRMPPPLDHVGRKLTGEWIQKVLEGKGDVRPHFLARMPVFSEHAKGLAAAFIDADKRDHVPHEENPGLVNATKADLEAGRQLLDSGCVQCHALRSESLPGSIGIDLADVASRIQPEWFYAFLLNPASLKKNTRMPAFFADGKSSNPHILDGDIPLQIASIWGYLNTKDQPLPTKLEQSRAQYFELQPTDRPVLLRTFMEPRSGGTHAIAVGLPGQHNFAYDAKGLRLAEIWKGKFLNAQGTWFDRSAPPAIPLGNQRIQLPIEAFVEQQADGTFEPIELKRKLFRGYRLDDKGIPTFCYSAAKIDIEDRVESKQASGLLRVITIRPNKLADLAKANPIWLVLADDATEVDSNGGCSTRSKLTIQVSGDCERLIDKHNGNSHLMIAIPNRAGEMEVLYQY